MNYIQEINSFHDWLIINPSVSSDEIALWYALMSVNNMCKWQKEFTVAISTIMDKSRLSRTAIYRSRNKLVQLGRISVKERQGNQCAVYQIVSLYDTQSGTQIGTQSGTQSDTQSGTIKKTKVNKTSKSHLPPSGILKNEMLYWDVLVKAWFDFYEKKFSSPPTFDGTKGKHLKTIITRLKKMSEGRPIKDGKTIEWTEEYALKALNYFFEQAWLHDKWLQENFELANLSTKFDSITNTKKENGKGIVKAIGKTFAGVDYNQI